MINSRKTLLATRDLKSSPNSFFTLNWIFAENKKVRREKKEKLVLQLQPLKGIL